MGIAKSNDSKKNKMIKAALVFFGFTAAQCSPDDIQAVYGIQVQPDPTVVTERAVADPDAVDSACTTCIADNYEDCVGNATVVDCLANEESCHLIERRRGGVVEFVEMGCKALQACENDKKDNRKMCTKLITDKNDAIRPSVCRTCFATDAAGRQAQTDFCQTVKTGSSFVLTALSSVTFHPITTYHPL